MKGKRVLVAVFNGHPDPQGWIPGTVAAENISTVAVNLDNGTDWIGSKCYIRPE